MKFDKLYTTLLEKYKTPPGLDYDPAWRDKAKQIQAIAAKDMPKRNPRGDDKVDFSFDVLKQSKKPKAPAQWSQTKGGREVIRGGTFRDRFKLAAKTPLRTLGNTLTTAAELTDAETYVPGKVGKAANTLAAVGGVGSLARSGYKLGAKAIGKTLKKGQ